MRFIYYSINYQHFTFVLVDIYAQHAGHIAPANGIIILFHTDTLQSHYALEERLLPLLFCQQ